MPCFSIDSSASSPVLASFAEKAVFDDKGLSLLAPFHRSIAFKVQFVPFLLSCAAVSEDCILERKDAGDILLLATEEGVDGSSFGDSLEAGDHTERAVGGSLAGVPLVLDGLSLLLLIVDQPRSASTARFLID